jgi:hypothetical protein
MKALLTYLVRCGDASSQWLNTVFLFGQPNESVSGRAYRSGWHFLEWAIDTLASLFERSHCLKAFEKDVYRAHDLSNKYPLKNLTTGKRPIR